jgi:hypothetical protein
LLFAYLRPTVICELMELHTTASMYPAISTTALMRRRFLRPDDATIKKVKHQITAARAARREAHALLAKAKQASKWRFRRTRRRGWWCCSANQTFLPPLQGWNFFLRLTQGAALGCYLSGLQPWESAFRSGSPAASCPSRS